MERNEKGQFLPGQTGNPAGRPDGARNKLGQAFIAAVYDHWTKHGAKAIAAVYEKKPEFYLTMIMKLLPDNLDIPELDPFEGIDLEEVRAIIAYCRNQIRLDKVGMPPSQAPDLLFMSGKHENVETSTPQTDSAG